MLNHVQDECRRDAFFIFFFAVRWPFAPDFLYKLVLSRASCFPFFLLFDEI